MKPKLMTENRQQLQVICRGWISEMLTERNSMQANIRKNHTQH